MEFTSFKTLVKEEVQRRAGEAYRVRLNDVVKNNGVVLSGLTVMQDDSNISPTIYLNNYYEAYESGEATLGMVVSDVMDAYNKNKVNRRLDMRYFLNYESIKGRIVLKLINTEKNRELLKDIPHMEFLDLSIVFQCLISNENIGSASVLIHNAHAKLWGVDSRELYRRALQNTPKLLKYQLQSMKDVLNELVEPEDGEPDMGSFSGCVPMYVLSNERRTDGAACMLYPNLIEDFSRAIGSSLYIIPSSVHELLLLSAWHFAVGKGIVSMLRDVIVTQLSIEEVLSDSLYFYDSETKEIRNY